ncbi:MAG: universal stress protein [Polyangiaceae bacterium]|nr:universal stress protein [Polyangiaceae bacterium]
MMRSAESILVAYDGSPASERALKAAVRQTSTLSQGVIHVVSLVEPVGGRLLMPDGRLYERWAALDCLRLTVAELVRAWGNKAPGVSLAAHLRSGEPVITILQLAEKLNVDLVLVGESDTAMHGELSPINRELLRLSSRPVRVEVPAGHLPTNFGAISSRPLFSLRQTARGMKSALPTNHKTLPPSLQ